LRSALDSLAHTFATGVLSAIRGASIEDLLAESGARRGPRGGTATTVPRARKANGGRLVRRSPEQIAKAVDAVVSLVRKSKTGLRAEEIRKALDLDVREMPRILKTGVATKRLTSKGQKRSTTYSAATKATTTKGTSATKKATATRSKKRAAPKAKRTKGTARSKGKRPANQPSSQPAGAAGPSGPAKK
jgi:hypothetical protein